MSRRIIVIEDFNEDENSVEKAIELLENQGLRAYQVSNIFSSQQLQSVSNNVSLSTETNNNESSQALATLLQQKTLLEDELRKYRVLLENSSDILYALDLGGNISFVTSNVLDILGYRPEELVGKNFLTFLPPEQHNQAVVGFVDAISETRQDTFQADLIAKDGHLLAVEISARIYYENGRPLMQIGLVRDITERKRLQAQMVKRNRELSALYSVASALTSSLNLESLMDECLSRMLVAMQANSGGIYLINSNGDFRQGTQRGLSENFKKIYPYLHQNWAVVEKTIQQGRAIIVEDLAEQARIDQELVAEIGYRSMVIGPLRANNSTLGFFMLFSKGKHSFTASDHDLFISLGNQVGLALQTGTLYSELNNTVLELRQTNQRLDDATRHKSEFLAAMSHELRTPLNIIIGFSEMLQDQNIGPLNTKQLRYVTNVLESGKHLLALVNDVLDLAKVESGKMKLNQEELNPLEVVQDSMATLATLAAKKNISLSSRRSGNVPNIKADRGKLKQIMYNLYSNAIKFTNENGWVETETRVAHHTDGDYLEINVSDNGIGIKPQDQERIFEEFQMVDGTLAKRQSGTGLGLALCRKLAEMHDGTVTVKSNFGEGSTFTLSLPMSKVAVNHAPKKELTPIQIKEDLMLEHGVAWQEQMQKILQGNDNDLVLIVEDDDKAAELLETYISQTNSKVERSRSGEEALLKARTLKPTLITLDIVLPHKNGWDVLRELKADPQTADIPVLVVSMLDNKEISFQLGAVECFVKPIERDSFLTKIKELKAAANHRKRHEHIEQHLKLGETLEALVIDDNPQDNEFVSAILQQAGLKVTAAHTGREGWQQAQTNPPDLVILDMLLPDTDGFNVLAQLRKDPKTIDVPVVVFTAKDLNTAERGLLSEQAEAVLQKGGGRQQLLDEILKLSIVSKQ